MKPRNLRRRVAFASSLGAGVFSAAVALSAVAAGTASAATIPAYPGTPTNPNSAAPVPAFGTYPNWLPYNATSGAEPISNVDHSEGSDTTLFVMQQISNLYSHTGILPFTCGIASSQTGDCQEPSGSYNPGGPVFNQGTAANPNNTQSDETDNFSGTEELQGQNDVGSGNGQSMLCGGTPSTPGTLKTSGNVGINYFPFIEAIRGLLLVEWIQQLRWPRSRVCEGRRTVLGLHVHQPGRLWQRNRILGQLGPAMHGCRPVPQLLRCERNAGLHRLSDHERQQQHHTRIDRTGGRRLASD